MEVEIQVVDASYTIEGDKAVVELFGRARDGRSVAVRCEDFRPYFHFMKKEKSDLLPAIKQELRDEIISIQPVSLFYGGEKKDFYKVTIKTPEEVKNVRKKFQPRTVFASSDIIYALRFYYDLDLGLCIRASGEAVERSDYYTDVVLKASKVEQTEAFPAPLTYLSFDIECSIRDNTLLTLGAVVKKGEEWTERIFSGDEDYIIREFERFVKVTDPDIITGYNIDNYDITQLVHRAAKKRIAIPHLSRNKHTIRQHDRFWRATGRVIADAWWHTKLMKHPKKETLNAVAQQYLGKKKLEIVASNIDRHWETEREKVMVYCLNDARLALELLIAVKAVDKGFNIGAIAKLPLSYAMENKTTQLIDSLLIRAADREGYAVPCTNPEDEDEERIKGAYVHEVATGIRNWIVVLDFKSMYPNIMINHNLCFSTYDPKEGTIVTPIGAKFKDPSIRKGIVPRVVEQLIKDRARIKRLMKEKPDWYEFYDGLQYGVKVLANAIYGAFTSHFYRFTNPQIGASITAYGREMITAIIETLENEGFEVVLSDTDSTGVQSPYHTLDETVKFGKELAERFSKGGFALEFEKVFEAFFSHGAKKRYVGKMVWPTEDLFVRGYEMRRTDAFDLQSETLEAVFNLVLDGKPTEAIDYAREVISDLKKGRIDIGKLVISKTCKSFEAYRVKNRRTGKEMPPERMASVRVAQKLMSMQYPFTPGSKVSWIVVDNGTSPTEVEPYVDGVPFIKRPDLLYYAERLATTIGRVGDAFGWPADALIEGKEQQTLIESIERRASMKRPTAPQPQATTKTTTLEGFGAE
jgi:DNA polymerase I